MNKPNNQKTEKWRVQFDTRNLKKGQGRSRAGKRVYLPNLDGLYGWMMD